MIQEETLVIGDTLQLLIYVWKIVLSGLQLCGCIHWYVWETLCLMVRDTLTAVYWCMSETPNPNSINSMTAGFTKKTERGGEKKQNIWAFKSNIQGLKSKFEDFETLESPNSKEIKPVNRKGNQLWIFIGRTGTEGPVLWPPDAKSQLTGKDPDAGKDWGQEKKGVTGNEMPECITNSMDMSLSRLREMVKDREVWHASLHGIAKSQTGLSNWTTAPLGKSQLHWACFPVFKWNNDVSFRMSARIRSNMEHRAQAWNPDWPSQPKVTAPVEDPKVSKPSSS